MQFVFVLLSIARTVLLPLCLPFSLAFCLAFARVLILRVALAASFALSLAPRPLRFSRSSCFLWGFRALCFRSRCLLLWQRPQPVWSLALGRFCSQTRRRWTIHMVFDHPDFRKRQRAVQLGLGDGPRGQVLDALHLQLRAFRLTRFQFRLRTRFAWFAVRANDNARKVLSEQRPRPMRVRCP